ncbi:tetratricopeptide repeat-containing sensor histidine kinase [Aquimarina megaterium]|uniref:tetratricopeptide repeat-containing sensor histidine kinase n=1 Tax=Aquimarina megaterium TaxID=1443666 RepID=UPI00046E94CD|nr:tetratricopeptide repeat protein [Aquimarina megaterium]
MNKGAVFLFLVLSFSYLYSQPQKTIESLIKKGDSLLEKKQSIAALHFFEEALLLAQKSDDKLSIAIVHKKVGVCYYRLKNYVLSERHYHKALVFDSLTKTAADNYYNIALVKRKINQNDSVLSYLEKSLKIYKTLNYDQSTYNTFLSAGVIYKNRRLYEKSLEYLVLAYHGFEVKNKMKLGRTCMAIGNVHYQIKNYKQALKYYHEALRYMPRDNKKGKAQLFNNIAIVYKKMQVLDSVIINYKKALSLITPKNKTYGVALQNLALVHGEMGRLELAQDTFEQAIVIHKRSKDTTSLLYSFNGITEALLKQKRVQKAKLYLDTITDLLPRTILKTPLLDFFKNKADYHAEIKEYKTALYYQKEYTQLFEKVYNLEQTEIIQNLQSRFDYEKKENIIEKLSLENKNNELQIESKNKSLKIKNLIIISLCILVLIGLMSYYIFAQRQKVAQQRSKIEKLEAIYKGQDAIQKRIARDLHDIISNSFDGLRLKVLALLRTPDSKDAITNIAGELQNMNQQVRFVSHRLSPIITNHQFIDVIKARLTEFQAYHKILVVLQNEFPSQLNALHEGKKNNFYGIILEILQNVAKHSQATELHISNQIDNSNHIHFTFLDNGVGITNDHPKGIGIQNIRQRTDILRGRVKIQKVNLGTEIHIQFPLKNNASWVIK